MTSLHPSAHFLIGFATAMFVAFLLCACLSSCTTPQAPDEFDRQLEAAIAAMFNPDGSPRQ